MIKITSEVFSDDKKIPKKYTCDGENINPPLSIDDVPEDAKSLVLIMDDPDAPVGVFDHWVVFNIDPSLREIKEGIEPKGDKGVNGKGERFYTGPCPPSGTHRYQFKIYALDDKLDIPQGSTKVEIEQAMDGHILDQGIIIGLYQR